MAKLEIEVGNIFDYLEDKDAIVNSSNQYMISGSGISGAIYKKADKDILENYCKENFLEEMKVNEVRMTPGFNLGVDIIHIYAPKFYFTEDPINDLIKSYNNIFDIAKEKGYKNIISVSIGTGVHGYKHNDVSKVVMQELKHLTEKYDINFTLVLSDVKTKEFY